MYGETVLEVVGDKTQKLGSGMAMGSTLRFLKELFLLE